MYRGSRTRGRRSRGNYHSYSHRDANTHLSRFRDRSGSPKYPLSRRPRVRSRSPSEEDLAREHRREKHWSRDDEEPAFRRRRSISPARSRERSRSPGVFTNRGRREERSRSRDHEWDEREDDRDLRRHRHEEFRHGQDGERERSFKTRGHHPTSRNGRSSRHDNYNWKADEDNHDIVEIIEDDEEEGVHDLREIIKRSREVTGSPRNTEFDGESIDADQYFKEFVPTKSRWEPEDRRGHNEFISFKKSIHNDIHEEPAPGQFVSSKDSHPEIPYFDGNDQEVTPRQLVKKIEDLGYANGWNSNELKCQMAAKLRDGAREWFLKDELMNEPWDKVKTQFIKMHPTDMDYYQQLKKMMDRTKFDNESYSNYFTFKTMLMSAVGITGRRAVSCLIGGLLNQELETQCYQKNFATSELLFEYLHMKKEQTTQPTAESSSRKSTRYSPHKKDNHTTQHKKPLLKTPKEPPIMNNLLIQNEGHDVEFSKEPFVMSKPEYEQKHLIKIKIRNHTLDAYNDMTAQCVTIKEESAKHIFMEYSRRRTTIIGFRGVPVMALGDCDIRMSIDQATINSRVYVVPNICQDKPVVIGKTMREHQHLTYHESQGSISFKQRTSYPSSFATNEKRKEKSNHAK